MHSFGARGTNPRAPKRLNLGGSDLADTPGLRALLALLDLELDLLALFEAAVPAAIDRAEVREDVGSAVVPTPLEIWLTARWGAHTRKAGRTWWVPNEHGPFPVREAEIVDLDDELVAAAGVPPVGEPLRALFSTGVRAQFGRPSIVAR